MLGLQISILDLPLLMCNMRREAISQLHICKTFFYELNIDGMVEHRLLSTIHEMGMVTGRL